MSDNPDLMDRIEAGIHAMLDDLDPPQNTQDTADAKGGVVIFADRIKALNLAMQFAELRGKTVPAEPKKAGIDALREQLNSPPAPSRRGSKPSAANGAIGSDTGSPASVDGGSRPG